MKTYFQLYYEKNKEKRRVQAKEYYLKNKEKCLENSKAWAKRNKEKVRLASKNWARKDYLDNPDKYKEYRKTDIVKKARKRYYESHKEECSNASVRRSKERFNSDPLYKLTCVLRARIHGAFRYNLSEKADKSFSLLGCTAEKAKKYLEKQFSEDMNWGNHGKLWEIDHIKPISSFNLTDEAEQKKAFNFTNLQPLYKIDNRKKGSREVIQSDPYGDIRKQAEMSCSPRKRK